jgi:hypothetical protein
MNALDVLKYGNLTVLRTIEGLPHSEWDTPDVCGVWSVKEIIAHLASFEDILVGERYKLGTNASAHNPGWFSRDSRDRLLSQCHIWLFLRLLP